MKLSEAKRRIRVGMEINVVAFKNPKAAGKRTVTKVQGNGFWFSHAALKRGFCPWPAARLTKSEGPDAIALLLEDGSPMSTLTFPAEGAANIWPGGCVGGVPLFNAANVALAESTNCEDDAPLSGRADRQVAA